MIPIPKELQGEAKDFLEWIKNIKPEVYTHQDIENYCYNYSQINAISYFYSQPFSPEMITEYFEGWKEIQIPFGRKVSTINNDISVHFTPYTHIDNYHHEGRMHDIELVTQTLNDFIRDCQRAGVKLAWKK